MTMPTHTCFAVRERGENKKAFWIPIGSGWVNKDGSLNLRFDVLPIDGKVCVRLRKEDEQTGEPQIDFAT